MNATKSILQQDQLLSQSAVVADQLDADVILYNGATNRAGADLLIELTAARRRRSNVLLILVTQGGDADSAYRIARWLQRSYERFILYVSGYCKSAGTLIATGAHELVISEYGELGPLDVQMLKRDELSEYRSGLDVHTTFSTLHYHALDTFMSILLRIKSESGEAVSLKMAMEIATSITTGLFTPIYSQIDPIHIGESVRAINIASEYGERLINTGGNIRIENLEFIISGYPSHGFVIDKDEAADLFQSVRAPDENETYLSTLLEGYALIPSDSDGQELPIVKVLSPEQTDGETENDANSPIGGNDEQATHGSRYAPEEITQDSDPHPTENDIGEAQPQEALHIAPNDEASAAS